jgi:hypothetical protein
MKRIPYIVFILGVLFIIHSLLFFTRSCQQDTGISNTISITPVDIMPEILVNDKDIVMDQSNLFPILKSNPEKWNKGNRKEISLDEPSEVIYGDSSIHFKSCHFAEEFLPYFYTYQTPVIFSLCSFGTPGDYSDAHAPFGFSNVHFQNNVSFEQNTFYRDIYFHECRFDRKLEFAAENTFVQGSCTFMNCAVKSGIQFEKVAGFDTLQSRQAPTELVFSEDTIHGCLDLSGFDFKNTSLIITDTWLDSLNLEDARIKDKLSLRAGSLQDRYKKKVWANSNFLRFFLAPYFDEFERQMTLLNISGTDVEKISLDYSYFKLYFPKKASPNDISALYKQLLDKYSRNGELINYQAVDIDFHRYLGGLFNWISHFWWNYGYTKQRIFFWTILFLFVFTICNYFNLAKALASYKITNIQTWIDNAKSEVKYRKLKSFFASLLYTSGIFFGIKLDFEKLQFSKMGYSVFILFQFLIGLVCTGFIVNLIFSK